MSSSANALRGEAELIIDRQSYILRPTFEALVAAEEELGSLFSLVERASQGALSITEITALLWHCLPSNTRPSREALGRCVIAMGLLEATKPIRKILAQVLKGQK